jgi:hypothetical protein
MTPSFRKFALLASWLVVSLPASSAMMAAPATTPKANVKLPPIPKVRCGVVVPKVKHFEQPPPTRR